MWKCPKCEAMNYQKGACECCGFDGGGSAPKIHWTTWSTTPFETRTDKPFHTPIIWC